jgi:phosphate transport system substrate-binding protein
MRTTGGSVSMKKLWVGVAVLLLAATGCKSEKSGQASKLTLTGSSTIAPLMSEVAKRFEAQNPGFRVDVQTGGSSRGSSDARQGLADIGMVSRDLKPEESDLDAHAVALDGVAVIVHGSNPISTLTDEQVVSIYTGKITNWKDVGGADAPIVVVNKAEGRSTLELFLHYFKLKNSDIKAQVVIGDNQQGIKTVEGNPGAIGYVSIGTAEYSVKHGEPLKMLPMAGVEASLENVRSKKFPMSRALHLVTKKGQQNELARKFITFAQAPENNDLVEKQYFVPIGK